MLKARLVIDLGNSETRVMSWVSSPGEVSKFSNRFALVPKGYVLPEDYKTGDSTVVKTENGLFCNGEVCINEFGLTSMRPTALVKKSASDVVELALHRSIYEGYNLLKRTEKLDDDDLEGLTWDITLLLPPNEVQAGGKVMAEKLKSIKKVKLTEPKFELEMQVDKVKVLPEGFCAFIGAVFDGRKVRKGYKKYLEGTVLVMDIGAGTTDFCIVKKNKVVESTKHTMQIGGNNIEQGLSRLLTSEMGMSFSPEALRDAVITGKIKDGAIYNDVSDKVTESRSQVARTLTNGIRGYFEGNAFPIRDIEYLLVVGGGAMESELKKIPSVGEIMTDYFKQFSPNVELIPIPEEVNISADTYKPYRELNILGAAILSR